MTPPLNNMGLGARWAAHCFALAECIEGKKKGSTRQRGSSGGTVMIEDELSQGASCTVVGGSVSNIIDSLFDSSIKTL